MPEDGHELDLPDEIYGFGGWLLWLVATRSTALVDRAYEFGPARASRRYGMAAGHHIPTPSLIAWLLVAAEAGIPVEALAARGTAEAERHAGRHKVLRTMVSRAITSEPRVFRDGWIRDLAALCGLTADEATLLLASRGDGAFPVDPAALARAIERTVLASAGGGSGGPGGAVAASRTLPRDTAAFTGRKAELGELGELLSAGDAAARGAPRVIAIGGMAGVGKTAFAVHAAHLLAAGFPDGQFFLPLHGHTAGQRPADPADALVSLLLTVGVPIGQIPPGLEPRAALWRDVMAGRRVLLLLDDATGHGQVGPLLPAGPESVVLITSRRRLTALEDVYPISLDALPPDEAAELFLRLAGRAELDQESVSAIARMCGYLPLAVGMLARQLHHHPAWSAADLAAELTAGHDRLGLLSAEDVSVSAAFDLSYSRLPDDLRLLMRRLGLFPGTELEPWAVAALAGTDRAIAHRALNALYDHHLLIELAPGRFRLHDLVREYAMKLAETEPASGRDAAFTRLADFYLATATAAGTFVVHGRRRPVPAPAPVTRQATPVFPGDDDANRWLESERLNLDAVIRHSAVRRPEHALAILAAVYPLLTRGDRDRGLALGKAVLAGAVATGNQLLQAWSLIEVLLLQVGIGDTRAAMASAVRALTLFERAGDPAGELEAHLHLGWVRYLADDYQGAAEILLVALEGFRSRTDALGEAEALTHLGYVRYMLSEYPQAAADLELAVKIYSEAGVPEGELAALRYLGLTRQENGDYAAAKASFARTLVLSQGLRDRNSEMHVRCSLGYLLCLTGQAQEALGHLTAALELARDVGNRLGVANALNYLGVAQRLTGDVAAAVASERQSVALYQECGSRLGEANAWQELGAAEHDAADPAAAQAALERALELYRAIGEQIGEADTLVTLGDVRLAAADPPAARSCYQRALELSGESLAPLSRARALEGLGRSHPDADRPAAAEQQLRDAFAIYQRLGSPNAARVAALLGRKGGLFVIAAMTSRSQTGTYADRADSPIRRGAEPRCDRPARGVRPR